MATLTFQLPTGARMSRRSTLAAAALAAVLALSGCDSLLDTSPPDQLSDDKAVTTPSGARAALAGAYGQLQSGYYYGGTVAHMGDLYSDNATHTGTFTVYQEISRIDLRADNGEVAGVWNNVYDAIKRVNVLIQRVPNINGFDPVEQEQILGEAYFLRALHYFNLVRIYGGVPLRLEPVTDPDEAANITRATEGEVYAQILADLAEAEGRMSNVTAPVNHATQAAAKALAAKVHLTMGNYNQAIAKANEVQALGFDLAPSYASLFSGDEANTIESIFNLTFTAVQYNLLGYYWQSYEEGGRYELAPTRDLMDAYDTTGTDARFLWNVTPDPGNGYEEEFAYGTKWPSVAGDEDYPVIRYADVMLIKAEAFAQLNQIDSAVAYYNPVRVRAGLTPDVAGGNITTQQQALDAVDRERRLEFFGEGHRFFDLVRTGRFAAKLGVNPQRALWPIPLSEITVAPQITQNPGY
jgi:tetratricopeptide (TPR) repeat protein